MNKVLPAFAFCLLLCSCSKEVPPLSNKEMHRKLDSMIRARVSESDNQARIDLEYRIKIEVKAKVDSIVAARDQPQEKKNIAGEKTTAIIAK